MTRGETQHVTLFSTRFNAAFLFYTSLVAFALSPTNQLPTCTTHPLTVRQIICLLCDIFELRFNTYQAKHLSFRYCRNVQSPATNPDCRLVLLSTQSSSKDGRAQTHLNREAQLGTISAVRASFFAIKASKSDLERQKWHRDHCCLFDQRCFRVTSTTEYDPT